MPVGEPVHEFRLRMQRFVRAFGLLQEERTPCGQAINVSHAHALMLLLHGDNERYTPSRVALELGIDKSNGTRLCKRMNEAGYLSMTRDPRDGRARLVTLTPAGRRLAERVEATSRKRMADMLKRIPSAELPSVLKSLDILANAITGETDV